MCVRSQSDTKCVNACAVNVEAARKSNISAVSCKIVKYIFISR